MQATPLLDLAFVGGGIAGVIHLHYARQSGLDALPLEKQDGVGGLWRQLPAWQDIQISPADLTLGDLPLGGPKQPHILANLEAWVVRSGLADGIRLDSPVSRARYTGTCRARLETSSFPAALACWPASANWNGIRAASRPSRGAT